MSQAIGGQAVLEGVMMRGPRNWAVAIRTPEGDLNRFINVYVNGQDIRYLGGEATAVLPADEVRLLPAMAGGSDAPVRWSR